MKQKKPLRIGRPMGRYSRFAWKEKPLPDLAALLANVSSIEANAKLGVGATRFRLLRFRLAHELAKRGVLVPPEMLALRVRRPFSVTRWVKTMRALACVASR